MTVLTLPYPPSVNELFAHVPSGHGGQIRVKTKKYKQWIKDAGTLLMAQRTSVLQHLGKVTVRYTLTPPKTNHRRDLCNTEKAISDLLVSCNVIKDDSLIESAVLEWDRDWPDVCVRVYISNWVEA